MTPDPLPFDPGRFRVFQRSYAGRLPGPLGCLLTIVLCPIGIALAIVMAVLALLPFGKRRATASSRTSRASSPESAAREEALRRLVRAMALDDTFTAEEARQAGTLVAGGATVDDLLADGLERGWIEVRGDRLGVTGRGREETDERRLGS